MASSVLILALGVASAMIGPVDTTMVSSGLSLENDDKRIELAEYRPTQTQILRKKMIKGGRGLLASEYRYLADGGDGIAAFRFAKLIKNDQKISVRNDALHYFSIAVNTGKSFAVKDMVALLEDEDVATYRDNRLKHFERILLGAARRGNPIAIDGIISIYRSGKPFGRKDDVINDLLSVRASRGSHDAALKLAIKNLSQNTVGEADVLEASEYLEFAAESNQQAVSSVALALLSKLQRKDFPELFEQEIKEP
ncbi:MAG: hypothetical protein ABJO57_14355 [Lentilitoribacter sp.]